MEAAEYLQMAALQDRHWWFEVKRRTVAAVLERHAADLGRQTGARVLEVGAGTGAMSAVMRRHGRLFATDAHLPALQLLAERRAADAGRGPGEPSTAARTAGVELQPVAADLLRLPFADRSFALVGCFDVLYHRGVPDVTDALREIARVCAPGGYLAITDSAFSMLSSSHDVATHAARRFQLPDLLRQVQGAGLETVHASYFHMLLFPAAAALRVGKRVLLGPPRTDIPARSDLTAVAPWLNTTLSTLYRLETPLAARFRLPFGVSLLVLARRPLEG
ncbi:MAG TPA: class I SAM-dependent methyltransferase [Acidobacteriota bacterium]